MGIIVQFRDYHLKRQEPEQDLIAFAKQGAPSARHEVVDSVLYESSLGWIDDVEPVSN